MSHQILRLSTVTLIVTTALYFIISKVIFDKVYTTSSIIVDEEFHLPLGVSYCEYDFNKWDPKVTTFPGLYILSSLLFSHFNLCSTYWLRFVSLLSSTVNIILFYYVLKLFNNEIAWKNVITAMNLSILPPMYFFSHVYYTDVSSIMMTLLLLISSKKGNHYLASLFGALAIIMRQNNVIWICMLFGEYLLKELYIFVQGNTTYVKHVRIPVEEVGNMVKNILTHPTDIIQRADLQFILNCLAYTSILLSFMLFIFLNGSIVVGDKTAHEAVIHIPQLFYFASFTLIFGWPHFLNSVFPFLKFVWNNKVLVFVSVILCLIIVHFNTLVHPYMLADNRHYLFYIWNRFYGRYYLFRYGMVFVYVFALYGILSSIWNNRDVTFPLMYIVSTVLILVMQKLIEFRYYLFPFILFRIQLKKVSTLALILETLTYLLINAFTFYTFFNKVIFWDTYDYPQRLIW